MFSYIIVPHAGGTRSTGPHFGGPPFPAGACKRFTTYGYVEVLSVRVKIQQTIEPKTITGLNLYTPLKLGVGSCGGGTGAFI